MTTALDVAAYIREVRVIHGEMHLQKLAYYSQAWSLAWDGKPLFSSEILAWEKGPVAPELRHCLRGPFPPAQPLSGEQKATVDAVLAFYGHLTGTQLGKRTHEEAPWADAYARRPDGSTRCSEAIGEDEMRRFYASQSIMGEDVPSRSASSETYASDGEVLAIARRTSSEWSDTLEILSR